MHVDLKRIKRQVTCNDEIQYCNVMIGQCQQEKITVDCMKRFMKERTLRCVRYDEGRERGTKCSCDASVGRNHCCLCFTDVITSNLV